ncbi:MAG: response regulator [Desulfuromonadaceae bacterium]|nr:response regulator [Desulfuromonadaceae bacterium]
MTEPLNILVIEDSHADFLMVELHLRQKGLPARCRRVDTLTGLKEALGRENWDLVLSDYNVPLLNFQVNLDLLREMLPDIPVILVTGTVGEEKAAELLKLGVRDFVLKGNMARLVPAIERSLRDAAVLKEKRTAEKELRESNERFRMIYEHSIDAILLTRTDGSVLSANPEACRVFRMSETEICRVGRAGLVNIDDAKLCAMLEERKRSGQCRGEITLKRGDGSTFPAETSSAVFPECDGSQKTSMIIRDVTDRKKLEEQIRQAQKMEAIGQLAGGVAHDFNNILQAIFGYTHLILAKAKDNEPVKHYAEELIKASTRAADLTNGLLAFSRKQAVTLAVIDISEVIKGNEAFLRRLIREDIELKLSCSEEPLTVLANRGQIEQVFMNLVTNGRDAMPNGGRLSIETRLVTLNQEFIETHGFGTAGIYSSFSVSDTGSGMDKETQSHVFEPFFTTKAQGEGTGLGLSIAYGIVKKHDGFITVYSEPGTGTIFKIYLPIVLAPAVAGKNDAREATPVRGGTETILVGEDDAALRRLSKNVLCHYGYHVIEAVDGQDAVDKFIEYGDHIDLVILDAIMPNKNGKLACDEMRMLRPGLKVLFVSGYTKDIFTEDNLFDGNSVFIQKPVSPDVLLSNVREMLDTQTPGGHDN